jgi:hypothetical protein
MAERYLRTIGSAELVQIATLEASEALGIPFGLVEMVSVLAIVTTSGVVKLAFSEEDLEGLISQLPALINQLKEAKADPEWRPRFTP